MSEGERGLVLFGSELMLLRLADSVGGEFLAPETPDGVKQAAELCKRGLLLRDGRMLILTERGRGVLFLTASVPDGRMGFVVPQDWRHV